MYRDGLQWPREAALPAQSSLDQWERYVFIGIKE
jgi:hypothetical protein